MKPEIKHYLNIAEAISKLLHPFAEVVLHDLKKDQIESIFNPISKRDAGDPSYLDRIDFKQEGKLADIIGPYEKLNYDGRKLKSISMIIKNNKSTPVGFMCINLDISIFDTYKNILNAFLANHDPNIPEKHQQIFKHDLYEKINLFVQNHCLEKHLNINTLDRTEKKQLIMKLKKEGALDGKNATRYIARTLGVSRATVYNYLKEK